MKRARAENIEFDALNMGINLLSGGSPFYLFYFQRSAAPALFSGNLYVLA